MTEDPKAELYLLSCCLIDGAESIGKCLNFGMLPDWMTVEKHRIIFSRLTEMLAAGKSLDVSVLAQELTAAKDMEKIGGFAFLAELGAAVSTTSGFKDYLQRVRNLHVIRQVALETTRVLYSCKNYENQGLNELLDAPLGRLLSLLTAADSKDEPRWQLVVAEAVKAAETLIKGRDLPPETIIRWPWRVMDDLFEPMQRGQLVILGARPSVGKSSLARQVMAGAAHADHKVYFDTLEVNPVQVALQMAASMSGVGVRDLGKAHPTDQATFKSKLSELESFGITPSRRDRSLARIVARIRALHSAGKIDLAIIDHGGLIEDVGLANTKDEKMTAIGRVTKTLKLLAGELNIVVLLLWQLNRLAVNEGNREPRISDLRDSGSLEEDADKILMIHRPAEDPLTKNPQPDSSDKDDTPRFFQNVFQAKGRDDGTSVMSFYFTRRTTTFAPTEKPR